MGDSVKKHFELVSEAEFEKEVAKGKTINGLGVIEVFETSYPEIIPQEIIVPFSVISSNASSKVSPPTLSKYILIPSGAYSLSFSEVLSVL